MTSCVIYLRQSLDRSGDELAIARQLRECRRTAKQRGIPVSEVISDNSITASKRGRPGYGRLVDLIKMGAVDTVLILRIDRLLRLNDELEELIGLVEQHHIKVITVEGEIDLSTPQGRLIARILVSVARSEMEVKGARHQLANKQRAEAGRPHAGRRAYGYNGDGLTINEPEALVMKELGQRFLSGWSYNELADWLNAEGHRTTMGGPFVSVAIRQMLMRKRYAGVREYQGRDYPAIWPAIYDEDTWAAIQYTIRQRAERFGCKPMPRKFLLTGLVVCGACGASMNGTTTYDRKTGEPRRTYRCNRNRLDKDGNAGCGKVSRGAVPLEDWVRRLIMYRLDSPALGELLKSAPTNEKVGPLLEQQKLLKLRLDSVLDAWTDGTLAKSEFIRARGRAQDALQRVEASLATRSRSESVSGLLRAGTAVQDEWDRQTLGWQQRLVEMLVASIEVRPTRKLPRYRVGEQTYYFDSQAARVVWKA